MFWNKLTGAAIALGIFAGHALACTPTYVVAPGDTLSTIAKEHLGSIFEFQTLYAANRAAIGSNPNRIAVGMSLRVPCGDPLEGDVQWSVMPNPETISQIAGQSALQVLDIRPAWQAAQGMLPGTVSIPYTQWRGPEENPGEPPTSERVAEIIGAAGLRLDRPILIVHERDKPMLTGAAAVVYWILKSSGADQLAILRGGFQNWEDKGLPVTRAVTQQAPYAASVDFDWTWRADEVTVFGIATQQVPGVLLDARPHSAYQRLGQVGQALATTLPGARNLPAPSLLSALRGEIDAADGVDTVLETFRTVRAEGETGQVVTFCHVGELGALNWFYASELAGLPNVKLYPESVKGWQHAGGSLFEATH